MRFSIFRSITGGRRTAFALIIGLAALSVLISGASRAQQPDARPRTTVPAPTASPSPQAAQPSPTPATNLPGRRIAPQLGAPPPPPILKPKPTPTPDPVGAVINEGDIIKFNTELVTLHVRVIDRNNHPINNIAQSDFKVFEDGVP